MSFQDKHAEVFYTIVSSKLHIGNDMDSGHYIYGVLDYSKVVWWNYDYDIVTRGSFTNLFTPTSVTKY